MALFRKRPPISPPPKRSEAATTPPMPAPLPQFLRDNDIRTSLAPDAVITGKLSFTTPTRIEGKLKGELRCTQLVIIGPSAVVEGSVRADEVQIEGVVRGEIIDTRKLEIRPGGKFTGTLHAKTLVIREGGFFDGQCSMGVEESRQPRAGESTGRG